MNSVIEFNLKAKEVNPFVVILGDDAVSLLNAVEIVKGDMALDLEDQCIIASVPSQDTLAKVFHLLKDKKWCTYHPQGGTPPHSIYMTHNGHEVYLTNDVDEWCALKAYSNLTAFIKHEENNYLEHCNKVFKIVVLNHNVVKDKNDKWKIKIPGNGSEW